MKKMIQVKAGPKRGWVRVDPEHGPMIEPDVRFATIINTGMWLEVVLTVCRRLHPDTEFQAVEY